jgi:hypothetical protein
MDINPFMGSEIGEQSIAAAARITLAASELSNGETE